MYTYKKLLDGRIKYNIMSSYDVICTQMKRIVVFIIEVAKIHKKCISSKAFCT